MNKWIDVQIEPPPFDTRITVTDGKVALICQMEKCISVKGNTFISIQPEGVSGYEYEVEFDYGQITHWQQAPELPKGA